jgi:hypothetical protein
VDCLSPAEWSSRTLSHVDRDGRNYDVLVFDSQYIGTLVESNGLVEVTQDLSGISGQGFGDLDINQDLLSLYGEYPRGSKRFYAVPMLIDLQVSLRSRCFLMRGGSRHSKFNSVDKQSRASAFSESSPQHHSNTAEFELVHRAICNGTVWPIFIPLLR